MLVIAHKITIAIVLVVAKLTSSANIHEIARKEWLVKKELASKCINVAETKNVTESMRYVIVENVFHVSKNVQLILIVTTGIFVRIIDVLSAGLITNAAMVTIAVKWDAKRTNVSKMKIAKKMGKFAKTKNADTFAKPSGIATFTSFAMEVYAHIRNVIGTVHAEGCRRT